ncbi:hypothetical protein RJ640_013042 [Escallonia rubra]|uniref:Core domain-containing protein n=1 Tax=Escallonia rubra TaxID=112253 RepID=A0AA88RM65_9ASTE|nr:hypothetical protein RJ640_013042 [Escallonia rubra]
MAISAATLRCPTFLDRRLPDNSPSSLPLTSASVSFRSLPSNINIKRNLSVRSVSTQAPPSTGGLTPAIALTDNALKHLSKMRSERNEDLCLRLGVKQGGCSGMSYTMEFESRENARPDDSIIECNGFLMGQSLDTQWATPRMIVDEIRLPFRGVVETRGMKVVQGKVGRRFAEHTCSWVRMKLKKVCDPKSLLFLYGMQLDFSDALIGGGFSFKNPNASQTCGCGKSFAAEM